MIAWPQTLRGPEALPSQFSGSRHSSKAIRKRPDKKNPHGILRLPDAAGMNGNLSPSGATSIQADATDTTSAETNQLTILIADNDSSTRRKLAESLSRFHCTVLEFSTGIEAIESAVAEKPDAMIISTRLPDTDGLNAIADLRSEAGTANLPIVVLSTSALADERSRYLAAGAAGFFVKPASATEVHWAILLALQGSLNQTTGEPEENLPEAASF